MKKVLCAILMLVALALIGCSPPKPSVPPPDDLPSATPIGKAGGATVYKLEVDTGTLYIGRNSSGSAVSMVHVPKVK